MLLEPKHTAEQARRQMEAFGFMLALFIVETDRNSKVQGAHLCDSGEHFQFWGLTGEHSSGGHYSEQPQAP